MIAADGCAELQGGGYRSTSQFEPGRATLVVVGVLLRRLPRVTLSMRC
jgi:hypothetical protein